VRSLVGHGVGKDMHEDPQVPNYGRPGKGPELCEGMVLAIEPMTTAGRPAVRVAGDGWAIFSQDSSPAAHFEFTVAVTAHGPRILTPWHLPPDSRVGQPSAAGFAAARTAPGEQAANASPPDAARSEQLDSELRPAKTG
jgi:methionyl aminopeptidase